MKASTLLLSLLPAVMAAPATEEKSVGKRQVSTTDLYMWSYTLAQFTAKRVIKSPSTLDWSSDSCSWSPNNPLGFPFDPACHRHDFGYRNYKAQSRFTDANKLRIDQKFLSEYVHPPHPPPMLTTI